MDLDIPVFKHTYINSKKKIKRLQKAAIQKSFGKKAHFQIRSSCSVDFYNPGHNNLEIYNTLVKIRFTTNNTKLDI